MSVNSVFRTSVLASAFVALILVLSLLCVSGVSAQETEGGTDTETDAGPIEFDTDVEFEDAVRAGEETTVSPVVTIEEIPFSVDVSVEMTMYVDGEATETVDFEETVTNGTVVRKEFTHTFVSPGNKNVEFEGVFSALGQEVTRTISDEVAVLAENDDGEDGGEDDGGGEETDDGDEEESDEDNEENDGEEIDEGTEDREENEKETEDAETEVGVTEERRNGAAGKETEDNEDGPDEEAEEKDTGEQKRGDETDGEPTDGKSRNSEGATEEEGNGVGSEDASTETASDDGGSDETEEGTEAGESEEDVPMPGFTAVGAFVAVLAVYFFAGRER